MDVTPLQQCSKLGESCCKPRKNIAVAKPTTIISTYNLRARPKPGPNYYESRIQRRNWTPKRKPKAKLTSAPCETRKDRSDEVEDSMEAAKRCRRDFPEPMEVETPTIEDEMSTMSDAHCSNLSNDRLVEAVETMCTALGIDKNKDNEIPLVWNSSEGESESDVYARLFPDYAHEFSEGFSDYNLMDLTDDTDIYYRIPVIERGVVTSSWEDARFVVKQETVEKPFSLPQDFSQDVDVKPQEDDLAVDLEDFPERFSENSSDEFIKLILDDELYRCEQAEVFGDCDTDSTISNIKVLDVKNVGETSGPEETTVEDLDGGQPIINSCVMFFGDSARTNWPSPTVFPHNKRNE